MSYLEILAECSIALAGFGALHAVLQGAGGVRGIFRAWFVVSQGALAFFLCAVALLMDLASLSADTLWRAASAIGALSAAVTAYIMIRYDARMTRLGHPPQALISVRTAQTLFVLAVFLFLGNFLEWPWQSGPLPYATAVTFILLSGLLALLHSFFVPVQVALVEIENDSREGRPAN